MARLQQLQQRRSSGAQMAKNRRRIARRLGQSASERPSAGVSRRSVSILRGAITAAATRTNSAKMARKRLRRNGRVDVSESTDDITEPQAYIVITVTLCRLSVHVDFNHDHNVKSSTTQRR